jgi:release factor glutamine methyltransferase
LEAEILLAHALDVERLHLYLSPDKPLTSDERSRYRTVVQERKSGTPLQHLVGEVSFFGLRFKVRRDALIPRPETEELLEHALKLTPRDRGTRCVDMGTGSGVIAVCLARFLPQADVTAVDVASDALRLAQENARLNGVEGRIAFLEGNWFDGIEGRFDLIVSNPPYVATDAVGKLAPEVRNHEPRVALDGGVDGLEQIRALVAEGRRRLLPSGALLLEVGVGQAGTVAEWLEDAGDVTIEKDIAGAERFVILRCP